MSDEEPPPLEDMTDFLKTKGIEIPVKSRPLQSTQRAPEPEKPAPLETFAPGIKKGFFSQQPKKKKQIPSPPEIPVIKPQVKKENPLVLKEVQEVMQYTNQHTEEWLTPTLLQRLAEHPFLAKGMSNPRLMEAVNELQKNPSLATTKYKYDQEVQVFFTEFSKIMADHFGKLAETKQKSFENDEEVQKIMEDKKVAKIIKAIQKGIPVDFHQ